MTTYSMRNVTLAQMLIFCDFVCCALEPWKKMRKINKRLFVYHTPESYLRLFIPATLYI